MTLPEPYASHFKTHKRAWTFFEAQAPWYRKTTTWWVISAKTEETRLKRLQTLIDACREGKVLR
jgi:uncharacterized protein YdeI (YjbR/CyaY-like superfamily)